jgi:hypothetical protein
MKFHKGGGYCWSTPMCPNHASHLPELKAQKSLEFNAVTAAVSRGKRMINSIGGFCEISLYYYQNSSLLFG